MHKSFHFKWLRIFLNLKFDIFSEKSKDSYVRTYICRRLLCHATSCTTGLGHAPQVCTYVCMYERSTRPPVIDMMGFLIPASVGGTYYFARILSYIRWIQLEIAISNFFRDGRQKNRFSRQRTILKSHRLRRDSVAQCAIPFHSWRSIFSWMTKNQRNFF